ncbi:hypothetical protein ACIQF6_35820 [Kitasatospora sp. NPDC092948]|uniref:hypothetical protein n=1 Tax=Kitasatospora sp. NPDC092948 TaxID=3364088 RepID=UPI0037F95790
MSTPQTAALSGPMTDSLLTALTSQDHTVHGTAPTVGALVRRKLAEPAADSPPRFRLTAQGRIQASESARALEGTIAHQRVRAAAMAEARRLMRLGDDERDQPARRILSWTRGGAAAVDHGEIPPERVLRWAASAILAGAEFRRLDPRGGRVECVHLTGASTEFTAPDGGTGPA